MEEYAAAVSKAVVEVIATVRRQRRLTMEELADRAGVARTFIGLIERGERGVSLDTAIRLLAALGLDASQVIGEATQQRVRTNVGTERPTSALSPVEVVTRPSQRAVLRSNLRQAPYLKKMTGLEPEAIAAAIDSSYHTLDLIDEQLYEKGSDPIGQLVELANLSSILGNLLGAGLADASHGRYRRNGPHKYPDLLATQETASNIEIKTALEGNRPKGHLPKVGLYVTFRYVLSDRNGKYVRGKETRGDVINVWEVKFGYLNEWDFSISSTAGDSGKTAVITTDAYNGMELVFFDPDKCPSPRLIRQYER